MAISNQLVSRPANVAVMQVNDEVLEKVMIGQDLSSLTAREKINYIGGLCKSLGLNPLTKPFEIMKFQGKEVPYARKDCTEQLRKLNNVSIRSLETATIMDSVYVVTAFAKLPDGREDSSTGAVSIKGLNGDALANAMMKAETKAKRRVTLSICGLGFLDESEIETIPNVQKREIITEIERKVVPLIEQRDIEQDILDISWADTVDNLKSIYTEAYKYWMNAKDKENMEKCVAAKDRTLAAFEALKDEETA